MNQYKITAYILPACYHNYKHGETQRDYTFNVTINHGLDLETYYNAQTIQNSDDNNISLTT